MDKKSLQKDEPVTTKEGWGVIAATFWGAVAFIGPPLLLAPLVPWFDSLPFGPNGKTFVEEVPTQLVTLAVVLLVLKSYKVGWASLGFRKFAPHYLWLVVVAFPIYIMLSMVITTVIAALFSIDLQEQQHVGYETVRGLALAGAGFALVVLTPIVEETIFRGFLFGAYRRRFGFVGGSLLVSVLFAAAHAQVNVGLDVFALSLFLCYLREKTQSLWPSILLHGLKNLVAFYFLFIIGIK